jgi:integrase
VGLSFLERKKEKLPAGIRHRSGKWHYYFELNGSQYSGNTDLDATVRNLNAAVAVREKARAEVLAGRSHLLVQPKAFSDASDLFLKWCDGEFTEHPGSAERIRSSFASLKVFFAKTSIVRITAGDIEDYKSWRREEHEVRPITLRHDLHALSKFFGYAKRHKWAHENPVDEVEIPSGKDAVRMNVLTPETERIYFSSLMESIARAKHPRSRLGLQALYDLGRLMIQQGCRPEEFCELEWTSVDFERGLFKILYGKTAAARRTLRMTAESREILSRRYQQRGPRNPGLVFPSQDRKDKPIHRHSYRDTHDRILDRIAAKLPDFPRFVVYDLRHSWATRMATEHKCPLPTLAALLGHSNLSCIQKYCHVQQDSMDQAMDAYSDALSATATAEVKTDGDNTATAVM